MEGAQNNGTQYKLCGWEKKDTCYLHTQKLVRFSFLIYDLIIFIKNFPTLKTRTKI
jgi:hypothetical protein